MPTTTSSKRQVQTNSVPSRQGLADWLSPFLQSSVGGKYLGAVTQAEVEPGRYVSYLELHDPALRHDVYSMMIYGFRNPVVALLYVVAQLFLFLHLTHGVASMFQTVGLNAPRAQRLIRTIA